MNYTIYFFCAHLTVIQHFNNGMNGLRSAVIKLAKEVVLLKILVA